MAREEGYSSPLRPLAPEPSVFWFPRLPFRSVLWPTRPPFSALEPSVFWFPRLPSRLVLRPTRPPFLALKPSIPPSYRRRYGPYCRRLVATIIVPLPPSP